MSDWDHDGDEDFADGVIEGVFWMAPVSVSFLIVVASLLVWAWVNW